MHSEIKPETIREPAANAITDTFTLGIFVVAAAIALTVVIAFFAAGSIDPERRPD